MLVGKVSRAKEIGNFVKVKCLLNCTICLNIMTGPFLSHIVHVILAF